LTELGISKKEATNLTTGLRATYDDTKSQFIAAVKGVMPNRQNNDALERLFVYRNKMVAHQERLDEALKEQLNSLPSLVEMERLNNWATDFCILSISLLTNTTLLVSGPSARMAALNVAAKLLDKKFDLSTGSEALVEQRAFFSRL